MDEAVPPGADDRRLQYKSYTKRDGVRQKELVREKKTLHHEGPSVAFSIDSRLFQGLERAVSFMDKVIDGLIAITSPVCLNK